MILKVLDIILFALVSAAYVMFAIAVTGLAGSVALPRYHTNIGYWIFQMTVMAATIAYASAKQEGA